MFKLKIWNFIIFQPLKGVCRLKLLLSPEKSQYWVITTIFYLYGTSLGRQPFIQVNIWTSKIWRPNFENWDPPNKAIDSKIAWAFCYSFQIIIPFSHCQTCNLIFSTLSRRYEHTVGRPSCLLSWTFTEVPSERELLFFFQFHKLKRYYA